MRALWKKSASKGERVSNPDFVSAVAVAPVKDHHRASAWYSTLLDRSADVVPMDDVAEWRLTDSAWLQVTVDPRRAGSTTIIIGVDDLDAQHSHCYRVAAAPSQIEEYPDVVRIFEVVDPDGNTVAFVQDISSSA